MGHRHRTEFDDPRDLDVEYFQPRQSRVEGSYTKATVTVNTADMVQIDRRDDREVWHEADARLFAEDILAACDWIREHPNSYHAAEIAAIERLRRGGVTISFHTDPPAPFIITAADLAALNEGATE